MSSLSYRVLFLILFVGLGLVLLSGFLKTQQVALAPWLTLVGLGVQFIAGVLLLWKFASGFDKKDE